MLWNNVETKPGPGYPRYWEDGGGGFDDQGNLNRDGLMPAKQDHGDDIPLNHDEVSLRVLKLDCSKKHRWARVQIGMRIQAQVIIQIIITSIYQECAIIAQSQHA